MIKIIFGPGVPYIRITAHNVEASLNISVLHHSIVEFVAFGTSTLFELPLRHL